MLGVPLEGFHGCLRLFLIFNGGVLGGACACFVCSAHSRIVGMSGGCYALLGMHLGDLLLNWRQKKFRRPTLFVLLVLGVLDLFNAGAFNKSAREGDTVSHAAHFGGYVMGLCLGIVLGRNLVVYRRDRVLQLCTVLVGLGLSVFCCSWAQSWPPRTLWDKVQWCWTRQVHNKLYFGKNEWQCVRCRTQACIDRWSSERHIGPVAVSACERLGGWSYTEGA